MEEDYKITLENGREYILKAENAQEAWGRALEIWPDLLNKDVRDIQPVKLSLVS